MHLPKRLISIIASGALVMGMLPSAAFAQGAASNVEASGVQETKGESALVAQSDENAQDATTSDEPSTSSDVVGNVASSEEGSSASPSSSPAFPEGANAAAPSGISSEAVEPIDEERTLALEELNRDARDVAQVTARIDADMAYATLAASGGDFERASSVQFPTWCEGHGQSDIRWYSAFKWDGAWICTVPIANHKFSGTYNVHAYAVVDGVNKLVAVTTFDVAAPKASISFEMGTADSYLVRISQDPSSPTFASVRVASWIANAPNQAGILWINAAKQPDGTWLATVPTNGQNRGDGTYANHVYVDCVNGISSRYVGAISHTFAGVGDATLDISLNADETTATITAYGGAFARATSVVFPTWSKPNQADIRWYSAQNSNGAWVCRVNISDHAALGTYHVHAYATIGGTQRFVTARDFKVNAPAASLTLSQDRSSDPNAPLIATLKLNSHADLASYVSLPTWTAANDQDDIYWYVASTGSDESVWTAEIPTTGPGRGAGTYISHAYVTLKNSAQTMVATSSFDVAVEQDATLTAQVNSEQTQAAIQAQGGAFARAQNVRFAVWSSAGEQDDIRWYNAQVDGSAWKYSVPISNHRTAGLYHVHAYAVVDGTDGMRGACDFTVKNPVSSTGVQITQTADQVNRDEATVSLTLDTPGARVTGLSFPTWTKTAPNGNQQDDIVWYGASSNDGLTWTATISTSGVGRGDDTYIVHAYAYAANGITAFVGSASVDLRAGAQPQLSATVNAEQTSVRITASGGAFARASSVAFPTWADATQKDIVWYPAHKEGGAWVADVSIARHGIAGTYAVHAYAVIGGAQSMVGATSFNIQKPQGTVTLSQTPDQVARDEATAVFTLSNAANMPKISFVQFPAWTVLNNQDDIVWYHAAKPDVDGGNTWSVTVPTSGVGRGTGQYLTHCYITCANGTSTFGGAALETLRANEMPTLTASLNADHTAISITACGGAFSTASQVAFPTWSEKGSQDDIIWYAAEKRGGQWVKNVPIANHRTSGTYLIHAYATRNGAQSFVASATAGPVEGPARANVSASQDGNGTITVTVENIQSISGIQRVQVPTWTCQNGQDDIIWHDAQGSADGTWTARIAAADHRGSEDSYLSHVYVTGKNGIMTMVGMTHVFLPLKNYVYLTGNYGSGSRTVWVKNPTSSDVQVPVWSTVGGQDDIMWVRASHVGDNLYRADLDCRRLKHPGSAVAHVYAGGSMIRALDFTVDASEIIPAHLRAMHDRIAGLASRTSWILAVDTNSCTVGIFRGSQNNWALDRSFVCSVGAWGSPTKRGDFTVGVKGYVFGHGYSCYYFTQFSGNYLFHSVKYYQGTFNIMDGRLGQHVSAGCVRLDINDAKWIYNNIPGGSRVIVY